MYIIETRQDYVHADFGKVLFDLYRHICCMVVTLVINQTGSLGNEVFLSRKNNC